MSHSYRSLLSTAESIKDALTKPDNDAIKQLVDEIKQGFKNNNNHWNDALIDKLNLLKQKIEKIAYNYYSGDKPTGIQSLSVDERNLFVDNIKASAELEKNINIRVQGHERTELSQLTAEQLANADAFRILPKTNGQRRTTDSNISARITINVNKQSFNKLWEALIKLFGRNPPQWLNQAKIMGPKIVGTRTDDAVIYLHEASLDNAEYIRQQLLKYLDISDFTDHTPVGMHPLSKGISYSETPEGQSTSHGQSRARIIASALAQSLLTNEPIESILINTLRAKGYNVDEPALVSQAWHDRNIKAGLQSGFMLRNGQASKDISQFKVNPLEFSNKNALSGDSMTRMGRLPAQGRAQFVKIDPHTYAIEYVYQPSTQGEALSVNAYFLAYNGANQSTKNPAYVDIPITAAEDSFVFTGSLTGCSVVVTKLNDTTYRVYHDGRVNSSILYDNVVMAFDYRDYQVSGADEGLGMAYMRFKNGQWQLILQRQEYKVTSSGVIPVLRGNEASISALYADEQWASNNQGKFSAYREQVHNKLKELASRYGINTEGIIDGIYVDGDFSLTHPAIEPWLNLITQIRTRVEETHASKEQSFILNEALSTLTEARSVERSWLWLQIKNKQGFESVVQVDIDEPVSGLSNESIHRRYDFLSHKHVLDDNAEFTEGNKNYKEIVINGFNEDMTSSEMKSLYLDDNLSIKERGALYHRIGDALAKEHINNVLKMTDKINTLFQHHGATYTRLAPQDFYLPLMGDNSGGRCYPLVKAMAVALSKNNTTAANILLNKLFLAAASPTEESSVLLKESLKNLHSKKNGLTIEGQLDLKGIQSKLVEGSLTKMYALNSPTHSMLVGKVVSEGNQSFYFYDPNFGIFTFDSSKKLFSAINEFMIKNKMASFYHATGSHKAPTFSLISINTEEMGDVRVVGKLKVLDLFNNTDLHIVNNERKELDNFIESQSDITSDQQIRSSLEILNAEKWGARIGDSYNILVWDNSLDNEWLPNFSNIETIEEGKYRVQLIHNEDTLKTRWIETTDETFIEFKKYFDEKIAALKKSHSFENNELQREDNISDAEHIDGLNSMMAVQTIFHYISNKNRNEVDDASSANLKIALTIHTYVGYAMITHGLVNDAAKITKLVHSLWKQGADIEKATMESFSTSFARTAGEKIGVALQLAAIGLDIYELANATNEAQKQVFGTQLAFDSAILATSAVEYGVTFAGIESLQGVIGPLAVPLMGLSIGIAELVKINAQHAQQAALVGSYFANLKRAYNNAGLFYDKDKTLIMHPDNVVYKTINFRTKQVELDSQFIYRGKDGVKWLSGRRLISDFGPNPGYDENKDHAINIREAVGASSEKSYFSEELNKKLEEEQVCTVVLPIVPKSYIKYEYGSLACATSRNDNGFSILRDMEDKYQFYFDFYHGALEKIIQKLHFEYQYTTMRILLDKKNTNLIVPNIPNEYKNKLLHVVKGFGGIYRININHGAALRLQDEAINGERSKWIIDASFVDGDSIKTYGDRLEINGVSVYTDNLNKNDTITIVTRIHEVYQYNLSNSKLTLVVTDARQWQENRTDESLLMQWPKPGMIKPKKRESVEQYFSKFASKNHIDTSFVVVRNYQHNSEDVGRSYYDTQNKRMIFTAPRGRKYHSGILSVVDGKYAYFFSDDKTLAWNVDVENGGLIGSYDFSQFRINGVSAKIINMWKENDEILITASTKLSDNDVFFKFEFGKSTNVTGKYLLVKKISNNPYLLDEIANTATQNVPNTFKNIDFLTHYEPTKKYIISKSSIRDTIYTDEILEIDGKDSNGINRRYWVRNESNTLIKPNLEPNFKAFITATGNEVKWTPPDDLMLVGSLFDDNQTEVFFFYSKKENKVYRQEGLGQDKIDDSQPTAKILRNIKWPIENVSMQNGKILLIAKTGIIDQISVDGHIRTVALNEKWLNDTSDGSLWWSRISRYFKKSDHPIVLLGLRKKTDNSVIPAWYFNERVIIAHSLSSSNHLHFVGFSPDNQGGYILDTQKGKLFFQASVDPYSLTSAFGFHRARLQNTINLPESIPVYPDLTFKDVKLVEGGILLIMENNGVIYHPLSNDYEVRNRNTLGSSLIINGTKKDDILNVNKIGDVKHLTMSGGEGYDIYKLDYQSWKNYDTILIDNDALDKKVDYIDLSLDNGLDNIFIKRNGNDLVIFDLENKTSLILREVYGSRSESYRHFDIRINNNTYHLDAETMADFFEDKQLSISIHTFLDLQISRDLDSIRPKSLSILSEQINQASDSDLSSIGLNDSYEKPKINNVGLDLPNRE
nr:hypothetical protein [Providencia stuartii]